MYFMSMEAHVFTDMPEVDLCNTLKITQYTNEYRCIWIQSSKLMAVPGVHHGSLVDLGCGSSGFSSQLIFLISHL